MFLLKTEDYANAERNKLSASGNAKVLAYFLAMDPEERAISLSGHIQELYLKITRDGRSCEGEFLAAFRALRERMERFRWSKEFVQEKFCVDYKALRSLYFRLLAA